MIDNHEDEEANDSANEAPEPPTVPSYFTPTESHTVFVTHAPPGDSGLVDDEQALLRAEAQLEGRTFREQRHLLHNGFLGWVKRRGPLLLLVSAVMYFLWTTFER